MQFLGRGLQGLSPTACQRRSVCPSEQIEPQGKPWRSSGCNARRNTQACAAHAHGSSRDLGGGGGSAASAVVPSSNYASVFSYLGLGGRNTDVLNNGTSSTSTTSGSGSSATAAFGGAAGSAGQALLRELHRTVGRLEQLAYDGASESMPGWSASQACGALMTLALLRRRPNAAWLNEFYAVSGARLRECSAADLAMLSYGVSELQLVPPQPWGEALLAVAMRLAVEATPGVGDAVAADATLGAAVSVEGADVQLQKLAVLRRTPSGLSSLSSSSLVPPLVGQINSAYDMEEDSYCGNAAEGRSSAIVAMLLQPAAALWGGLRAATASASVALLRRRSGSELVTVVYNLTAAGVRVEATWLSHFIEAMGPRLVDLSGDDLLCLLTVAAETCGVEGVCLVEPSLEWQARLFARMDGINWALQGRHLVGCLSSIAKLGLRLPPQWARRQLLSLQPSLPALTNSSLVQLALLLTALPLPSPSDVPAALASVSGSALSGPSASASLDRHWFAGWLADYRCVLWERRASLGAADLLSVISGVAAATPRPEGGVPPTSASPEARSALRSRSSTLSYVGWRREMVAAVATALPQSSLSGLCEAWQALAEADTAQDGSGSGVSSAAISSVASGGSSGSGVTAGDLEELRGLVTNSLAVRRSQLSTSDVAPVLCSLAAAGLRVPGTTLEALLAGSQSLLPGLNSGELVTVALSLVRLSFRPNQAWQVAFCTASRRRLAFMTPPQRSSLLVAYASLGMHLPEPWLRDFFAASLASPGSEQRPSTSTSASTSTASSSLVISGPASHIGDLAVLDGPALVNLLWAVSCVSPEPPAAWLEAWEYASMPRLRELGPNMLAVALKAMSTLHYRPSRAWQSAFYGAVQRRLFAAGAAQLQWPTAPTAAAAATSSATADAFAAASTPTSQLTDQAAATVAASNPTPAPALATPPPISSPATSSSGAGSGVGMLSSAVTPEALNSLVYSLASLDLAPPAAWLDELMDAVRCKLSMLSTLDLSVVLAFLVARNHRPNDEWWESFLEALENRFVSQSAHEMASLLIMLNALKVSPAADWLDRFCSATEGRLCIFQPSHLLQVLSCLHLFRHRPGQPWMAAFTSAVEQQLPRFSATELARVVMLLDHLNQRPSSAFMLRFYDYSRAGLAQLETQELVNVSWAVVSCSSVHPDSRWTDALVEAARPRLSALGQPQLRVLSAALSHMQRSTPTAAAGDFLAFAREFLVA